MTYSTEWDAQYLAGRQMTVWPFTDLVGLVKRFQPALAGRRVLELGCGVGANAPFFITEGAIYHGIDGSQAAIDATMAGSCVVGDFTKSIPFGWVLSFDLVVDRAAVTHNDTASIQACLALVFERLKSGGLYIGVDWFSHNHDEYANGDPDGDEYTKCGYTEGQFAGVGKAHFSDYGHLCKLFERFEILRIEEKTVQRHPGGRAATWNLVARKP